ncbi:hypothetical protein D3C79_902960 [compost metagenome]
MPGIDTVYAVQRLVSQVQLAEGFVACRYISYVTPVGIEESPQGILQRRTLTDIQQGFLIRQTLPQPGDNGMRSPSGG